MTLEQLIQEGEMVKQTCGEPNDYTAGNYIKGEPAEHFVSKSILFVEKNCPSETLKQRFIDAADRAVNADERYLNTMLGVLKAMKDFEQ